MTLKNTIGQAYDVLGEYEDLIKDILQEVMQIVEVPNKQAPRDEDTKVESINEQVTKDTKHVAIIKDPLPLLAKKYAKFFEEWINEVKQKNEVLSIPTERRMYSVKEEKAQVSQGGSFLEGTKEVAPKRTVVEEAGITRTIEYQSEDVFLFEILFKYNLALQNRREVVKPGTGRQSTVGFHPVEFLMKFYFILCNSFIEQSHFSDEFKNRALAITNSIKLLYRAQKDEYSNSGKRVRFPEFEAVMDKFQDNVKKLINILEAVNRVFLAKNHDEMMRQKENLLEIISEEAELDASDSSPFNESSTRSPSFWSPSPSIFSGPSPTEERRSLKRTSSFFEKVTNFTNRLRNRHQDISELDLDDLKNHIQFFSAAIPNEARALLGGEDVVTEETVAEAKAAKDRGHRRGITLTDIEQLLVELKVQDSQEQIAVEAQSKESEELAQSADSFVPAEAKHRRGGTRFSSGFISMTSEEFQRKFEEFEQEFEASEAKTSNPGSSR